MLHVEHHTEIISDIFEDEVLTASVYQNFSFRTIEFKMCAEFEIATKYFIEHHIPISESPIEVNQNNHVVIMYTAWVSHPKFDKCNASVYGASLQELQESYKKLYNTCKKSEVEFEYFDSWQKQWFKLSSMRVLKSVEFSGATKIRIIEPSMFVKKPMAGLQNVLVITNNNI